MAQTGRIGISHIWVIPSSWLAVCGLQISVSLFLICSTNSLQQTRKLKIDLTSLFISHCVSNYSANPPSFAFKLYSEHDNFHHYLLTIDFHSFRAPPPTVIHQQIARAIFLNFKIFPFPSNPRPKFLSRPRRHCRSGLRGLWFSPPFWLYLDHSTHHLPGVPHAFCAIPTWMPFANTFTWETTSPTGGVDWSQCSFSLWSVWSTLFKIQTSLLFPWPARMRHFILLWPFYFSTAFITFCL